MTLHRPSNKQPSSPQVERSAHLGEHIPGKPGTVFVSFFISSPALCSLPFIMHGMHPQLQDAPVLHILSILDLENGTPNRRSGDGSPFLSTEGMFQQPWWTPKTLTT